MKKKIPMEKFNETKEATEAVGSTLTEDVSDGDTNQQVVAITQVKPASILDSSIQATEISLVKTITKKATAGVERVVHNFGDGQVEEQQMVAKKVVTRTSKPKASRKLA